MRSRTSNISSVCCKTLPTSARATEIQQLAYFDKLTGLPNQTLLHDRIERLLQQTDSVTPYHALYLISLDGFKSINDTFGHDTGDELLQQVANKLKQTLPEQATLARMGGGNFSVLYPSQMQDEDLSKQDIARYSETLLDLIDDRYKLEDSSVHTSASIGICPFALNDTVHYDSDQLTRYTNMAMYEAKNWAATRRICLKTP